MISNEIHPLPESSCIWLERHAPELLETLQRTWIMYCEAVLTEGLSVPQNADFVACLVRVWAYSDFVAELCEREPVLLADLLEQGDLHRDYRAQEYREHLQAVMARVRDEEHLMDVLRHQRKREMLRIAWRDLAGWAGLQETLRDLSLLADACVDTALDRIYTWACRDWGTPYSETGQQQRLVVLGMGKLGAYELNFSSDIDLIFAFPEHGSTRNSKAISNEEFFTRLAQRLIHVIGTGTDHVYQALGQPGKELLITDGLAVPRRAMFGKRKDQIDIRGKVQLIGTKLTHSQHDQSLLLTGFRVRRTPIAACPGINPVQRGIHAGIRKQGQVAQGFLQTGPSGQVAPGDTQHFALALMAQDIHQVLLVAHPRHYSLQVFTIFLCPVITMQVSLFEQIRQQYRLALAQFRDEITIGPDSYQARHEIRILRDRQAFRQHGLAIHDPGTLQGLQQFGRMAFQPYAAGLRQRMNFIGYHRFRQIKYSAYFLQA